MTMFKMISLGLTLASLAGCVSPHGMLPVGVADDAGYTYHEAQACTDGLCGSGLASAALYGPVRADGTRNIIPLGSAPVTSTGTVVGVGVGLVAAGLADGFSHNPRL
jgi:hypothetical protein